MEETSSKKSLKLYLKFQYIIDYLNILTSLYVLFYIVIFAIFYIKNFLLETLLISLFVFGDIVLYIILTNIALNATKKLINDEPLNEIESYSKTLFPFITVIVYPLGIFYIYVMGMIAWSVKGFI